MGIRSMLERHNNMQVVGTAENGEDTLRLAKELQPDVLLLDVVMPGMSGIEVARRMKESQSETAILVLSSDNSPATIEALLKIGIDGFVPKTCGENILVSAIESVAAGFEYYGADISQLIERIRFAKRSSDSIFTPRELDVVRLCCEGLECKEIAERLGIQFRTVTTIKNNIFRKLGINNSVELVLYALKKHLIDL